MKTIFNAMPLNQYFKGKFHNNGFTLKNRLVKSNSRGFTLIELLIVVAIIAILTGIGATRYQEVIRRGRDAQRKSDLRSVATALEQYYSDRSSYPTENPGEPGELYCFATGTRLEWGINTFECDLDGTTGPDPIKIFSGTLPEEQTGTNEYYYFAKKVDESNCGSTETDCQRYVLGAILENTNDPEANLGCLTPQPTYNFCVTNP